MVLQQRRTDGAVTETAYILRSCGAHGFRKIFEYTIILTYQRYPTQRTSQEEMNNVRGDCESLGLSLVEADRLANDRIN